MLYLYNTFKTFQTHRQQFHLHWRNASGRLGLELRWILGRTDVGRGQERTFDMCRISGTCSQMATLWYVNFLPWVLKTFFYFLTGNFVWALLPLLFCLLKLLSWAVEQVSCWIGRVNKTQTENFYREINFRFRIHRTVYGSSGAGRQLERIREFGFECQSHEFLRQELFLDPWDSWWQCPLSTKHGADESFGRFQHSFPATGKYTNTVEILHSAV